MDIFSLSSKIQMLPVVHGSGNFTRPVRQKILSSSCDCVAVCLPPEFQSPVEQGIERLPYITLTCQEEKEGTWNYVPVDPSQPAIMALRIAKQEGIRSAFIDLSVESYQQRRHTFPDTFALRNLSLEKFCASLLLTLERPDQGSQHDKRARWMAYQLHQLEMEHSHIVFICSILDWPWIREAYNERLDYDSPEKPEGYPHLYGVEEKTLFFALTELPYITTFMKKTGRNCAPISIRPSTG